MMFTNKGLAKIIIPLVVEYMLAITIGMLDSVMVSAAGEAAISGVSLVDSLNLLLVYMFSALSSGGSVVIAQFMGKGDNDASKAAAKQLLWIVFLVSSAIMTFVLIFRLPILKLIYGSIDYDVMSNARIYFLFTAMSYPFLALYNGGAAIFHSMGKSKITMTASLVMNLINFFGNALLIYVYHMGAAGAAIATLFSRIVGAGIMLFLVHNKNNLVYVEKLLHYKPNMDIIKRICAIGIPNGLENGMFQFGKVLTQSLVSTFPTVQIAANAVANSITALQYVPGNATGTTMITVVGRCIGAGEKTMAKKYTLKLIGITYMLAAIISAVLCIFAKPIVGVFNLSGESLEIARNIILIHSLFICAVWPVAFTMTNAFRAASDVKYTMLISVSSMWVFRVGLSYVFAKHLNMGVMSIWVAMFCDWIFRASLFGIRYVRGTWLTKYKYDEL